MWELHQKLVQKGHDAEVVDEALEHLQNDGMLSDERYAEARANSLKNRGYGPRRLEMELREKRVPNAVVEAVMAQSRGGWTALARIARRKKFGAAAPQDFKNKARQMRFLQYRGFTPEQISQVVNEDEVE